MIFSSQYDRYTVYLPSMSWGVGKVCISCKTKFLIHLQKKVKKLVQLCITFKPVQVNKINFDLPHHELLDTIILLHSPSLSNTSPVTL